MNPNLFNIMHFSTGKSVSLAGINGEDMVINRYGSVPFFGDLPCSEECPIPRILGLSTIAE